MNTALFSGSDLDVVFSLVLTMSLSASWIAAAVLVLRLCLKRAPKWVNVLLWGIVAVRLVLPVSIESPLSLLPRTEAILPAVTAQPIQTGTAPAVGGAAAIASGAAMRSQPAWTTILAWVWLVGIAVLLLYTWISTQRLRRKVREAVRLQGNIYETEHIDSPFVLGVLRPRIYLPYHMDSRDREQVIAHEQAHLRRGDHVWKPLGFLLLTIHWFNPLLWLAFILLARDMEMACDEQVLEQLGTEEKKRYSTFLLKLSAPGAFLTGTPVAFGENSVKSRIKNILRYKKTRAGIAAAAVALVAGAAWFCLSNPASTFDEDIIGGADGPTSIFLAGKLSGGDDTVSFVSGENLKLGGDEEKIYEVVKTFAEAAGNRDADTVWELLSPVLQHSDDLGIQVLEDGTKTMGVSSPFLADGPTISLSIGDGNAEAEITYPSMTSDPLWWSWKDYITLEKNGDTYRVTAWKTKYYDDITSAAEFEEAYRMWQPDYLKPTDETADLDSSFASYLVKNDVAESYYGEAFSTPVKALETTLHVSGGIGKTEDADGGDVWVNYEFPDGTIRVRMTQPGIDEGSRIWVPKEIPMG